MLGTTIAHYKVTAKLGQGGMGEVYRATDTKLDREVAIKVLPESFAQDKERLARFEREAKVLASLDHPNIGAILGVEDADGKRCLILQLIEGETLTERLRTGAMPIDEALDVCKQIAEALEAAHEKGIIHRDLKPGNIKITPDGKVKVLDFGLAKAAIVESSVAPSDNSQSPTLTADYTRPGVILGTAAYMSPEQARAKPVDKRSDIWSFGCVLYECLTGKCLFRGEDVSETLATVIKGEPQWNDLPTDTPHLIQLLIRKCLVKDRKQRLHDISDARVDLEKAIADPNWGVEAGQSPAHTISNGILAVAFLLTALIALAMGWLLKPPPPSPPPAPPKHSELFVDSPYPLTILGGNNAFAVTRDGTGLVYNLDDGGLGFQMWDFMDGNSEPIPGASAPWEGFPFLHPDGSQLGCLFGSQLVTVSTSGGTPRKVGDIKVNHYNFRGADWGRNGDIVFAEQSAPLRLISAAGDASKEVTLLNDDFAHAWPQFLPDGIHVLFVVQETQNAAPSGRVEVQNITTGERKPIAIEECTYARYVASGHLLYTFADELFAVAFDLKELTVKGDPKRVLAGVAVNTAGRAQFDVADDGTLVYLEGTDGMGADETLVWMDTQGQLEPFTNRQGAWGLFDLSPDEMQVALSMDGDIWILDSKSKGDRIRPLERTESNEDSPTWSQDGEWVFYYSDRDGKHSVWKKKSDFSSPAEFVCENGQSTLYLSSVSTNYLMMAQRSRETKFDILRLAFADSNTQPEVWLKEAHNEGWPVISPDEKWIAYYSEESEQGEIYLIPMNGSSGSKQISVNGGSDPKWSRTGDRIFYRSENKIYSVKLMDREGRLEADTSPEEFFSFPTPVRSNWAVSTDNKRILISLTADEVNTGVLATSSHSRLKVVFNWFTELNELLPVDPN